MAVQHHLPKLLRLIRGGNIDPSLFITDCAPGPDL
jgi:hypothetical protein